MKVSKVEVFVNEHAPKAEGIAPLHIGFLVFPGFQPIDLSGPWQAFTTANDELGYQRYHLSSFGPETPAQSTDGGLRLLVDHTLDAAIDFRLHTLIVPGGDGVHRAAQDPAILQWLRACDLSTARTCSVCTGAFLLASAGFLDGRPVTTHWRNADRLRQAFPHLDVVDERIFCESGKYWTTAGVTAGIDLALTLIEHDCGIALAQRVARRLVVYLRRSGDQRQYSQTLRVQDRASAPFRDLIGSMEKSLAAPWTVDDMADRCNMSRRTFQRRFKQHFGVPPQELLKTLRQENAKLLLASGKLSRKDLARQVGLPVTELAKLM
ncbi:GlxA family transcriptional regulator [Bordetella genomosp. 9]|uniref:GlxA family transcriptional regulator n=1 Tax=Bordetella genomosp. 9 TaxID=1416803 RepID=UPI0027956F27|nr:GlxA family transcriptional regulator [Bordetella genomosp. 9]